MTTTKEVKPSHLSPYKSGSPSSIAKDLDSTNIQAKIVHDSTYPVTCYITVNKYLTYIGVHIVITTQV